MSWFKNKGKSQRPKTIARRGRGRGLRFELLERRNLLAIVNVTTTADAATGGFDMTLTGDGAGDSISMISNGAPGSYLIAGDNGTELEFNGGQLSTLLPVTQVNGNITVNLGSGDNSFTFSDTSGVFSGLTQSTSSTVLGNLTITNGAGLDTNDLSALTVDGNLVIQRPAATPPSVTPPTIIGNTVLTLNNVTVNGDTTINNTGPGTNNSTGTGGGTSKTTIMNSTFTGTAGGLAFALTNALGDQTTVVGGGTVFGINTSLGNGIPPFPVADTVEINNNVLAAAPGTPQTFASQTTFTNAATNGNGAGPIIYGQLTVNQGEAAQGLVNVDDLTDTTVWGGTNLDNQSSTTEVIISNGCKLGTELVNPAGAGTVVAPAAPALSAAALTVANGAGPSEFQMTGATVPYGMSVLNDQTSATPAGSGAAVSLFGAGGTSVWGGTVQIGGGANGNDTIGSQLSPGALAVDIQGDNGPNTVAFPASGSNGSQVTGNIKIGLNEQNATNGSAQNSITLDSTTASGLRVNTGNGSDTLTLAGATISNLVNVNLGGGNNTMVLTQGTNLSPAKVPLSAGSTNINGGTGDNTLEIDPVETLGVCYAASAFSNFTAPTVAEPSAVITVPSSPPAGDTINLINPTINSSTTSIVFDVDFSTAVTGVTAANFQLTNPSGGLTGLSSLPSSAMTVSPVSSSSATAWTVTIKLYNSAASASYLGGYGMLGLQLTTLTGITATNGDTLFGPPLVPIFSTASYIYTYT